MYRKLPVQDRLPHALYRAEQVRALDRCAIEEYGLAGAELMERAGAACYRLLRERWPDAGDITVLCGVGNNGGDGFVVARLARKDGLGVRVLQLGDAGRIGGDALHMQQLYTAGDGEYRPFVELPRRTDVIVDAILGTGLEREVGGDWASAIDSVNRHRAPVLAIDIPSGLHSDSGRILGTAVRAEASISFIGLKQGMFTGSGPDCCGDIHFTGLDVPALIYSREILSARRIDWRRQSSLLQPRARTAHKGDFGHVLVVGGAPGYSGAARMAGEAALRCGAGLVSLATDPGHAASINLGRPELMCRGVGSVAELIPLLEQADVVAVGPGLGRSAWAQDLLQRLLESDNPLVMDADALNLLAQTPVKRGNWVLTPHPGEAARLLACSTAEVQADRFSAVTRLWEKYGGTVVLKGAGSLVYADSRKPPALCSDGNPGMAGGGMGDVLTGVVAGLIAQGWEAEEAACMAVCLHASAADMAAADGGERGLLASDLFPCIRRLVNPETV